MYVCMYVCMNLCLYLFMYVCIVYMHMHVCIYMFVFMYVCMYLSCTKIIFFIFFSFSKSTWVKGNNGGFFSGILQSMFKFLDCFYLSLLIDTFMNNIDKRTKFRRTFDLIFSKPPRIRLGAPYD